LKNYNLVGTNLAVFGLSCRVLHNVASVNGKKKQRKLNKKNSAKMLTILKQNHKKYK
jgi:hypothetical protein